MDPFNELMKGNINPTLKVGSENKTAAEMNPMDLRNYISELVGVAGFLGGSLAGPAGSVAGGIGGSALGSFLEQQALGKQTTDWGQVAGEAALGGLLARTPYETGRFLTSGLFKGSAKGLITKDALANLDKALVTTGLKSFTPKLAIAGVANTDLQLANDLAKSFGRTTAAATTRKVTPTLSLSQVAKETVSTKPIKLEGITPTLKESLSQVAKPLKGEVKPVSIPGTTVPILRGTKKVTQADIAETLPNIELKRDIQVGTNLGEKITIPKGEKLTPYRLKNDQVVLQDGRGYYVSNPLYQQIRNASYEAVAKPFEVAGSSKKIKTIIYGGNPLLDKELRKKGWSVSIREGSANAILMDELGQPYRAYDILPKNIQRIVDKANYPLPVARTAKFAATPSFNLPGKKLSNFDVFLYEENKYTKAMWDIEKRYLNNSIDFYEKEQAQQILANKYPYLHLTSYKNPEVHWGTNVPLNVFASIRNNVREVGNKLTLHAEEFQSDMLNELGAIISQMTREAALYGKSKVASPYASPRQVAKLIKDYERWRVVRDETARLVRSRDKLYDNIVSRVSLPNAFYSRDLPKQLRQNRRLLEKVYSTTDEKLTSFELATNMSSTLKRLNEMITVRQLETDALADKIFSMYDTITGKSEELRKFFPKSKVIYQRGEKTTNAFDDWLNNAIIRELQIAADSGFDYFTWTTGLQTRDRWSLSKSISSMVKSANEGSARFGFLPPDVKKLYETGKLKQENLRVVSLTPTNKSSDKLNFVYDDASKFILDSPSLYRDLVGKQTSDLLGTKGADLLDSSPLDKNIAISNDIGPDWPFNIYDRRAVQIVEKLLGVKPAKVKLGKDFTYNTFKDVLIGYDNAGFPMYKREYIKPKDIKVGDFISEPRPEIGYMPNSFLVTAIDKENNRIYGIAYSNLYQDTLRATWLQNIDNPEFLLDLFKYKHELVSYILIKASEKEATVWGVKLTPDVVRTIKGEAPIIKTSGMMFENPTKAQIPKSTIIKPKSQYNINPKKVSESTDPNSYYRRLYNNIMINDSKTEFINVSKGYTSRISEASQVLNSLEKDFINNGLNTNFPIKTDTKILTLGSPYHNLRIPAPVLKSQQLDEIRQAYDDGIKYLQTFTTDIISKKLGESTSGLSSNMGDYTAMHILDQFVKDGYLQSRTYTLKGPETVNLRLKVYNITPKIKSWTPQNLLGNFYDKWVNYKLFRRPGYLDRYREGHDKYPEGGIR